MRDRRGPADDWRSVLRDRLVGEHARIKPGAKTQAAELGLGLDTSAYWFIFRCVEPFGRIVVVSEPPRYLTDPAGTAGATPFDSGGLWDDRIEAHPPFGDDAERVQYFWDAQVSLREWVRSFVDWLSDGGLKLAEYVLGLPPTQSGRIICTTPPNQERAWTWEVQLPTTTPKHELPRRHNLVMREDEAEWFLTWLRDDDVELTQFEYTELTTWCLDSLKTSPDPALDTVALLTNAAAHA